MCVCVCVCVCVTTYVRLFQLMRPITTNALASNTTLAPGVRLSMSSREMVNRVGA